MVRQGSLRSSAFAAASMGSILAGLLAWVLASCVVRCGAELYAVPEPSGWREWPVLPNLGGYTIQGSPQMPKYGLGLQDTELRDRDLCPRGGLSLDDWFVRGPMPSYSRSTSDIQLRSRDGVFVVSAVIAGSSAPQDPRFIVAFRRDVGPHLAFVSDRAMMLALVLGASLGVLVEAALRSLRGMLAARAYGDPTQYKPGTRDATGAITFDDGTAPVPASTASSGAAGPVLVEVSRRNDGRYRVAPSTRAGRVIAGIDAELLFSAHANAAAAMRTALRWSALILAAGALAAGYSLLKDLSRSMW